MKRLVTFGFFGLISCISALTQPVKFGIDNLVDTNFELLRGLRVALVSHAAARALDGRTSAEILSTAKNVTLAKILSPEHGFYGAVAAGKPVHNDSVFGVPVLSLYGLQRRPDAAMLEDIDVVVIDLQDIGVRSYTYVSTMIEVMIACADANKPVFVLDRANPWGGEIIDGPLVDDARLSFIGRVPVPYVHGMTIAEIATMANAEGWLKDYDISPERRGGVRRCKLTVVRLKRWTRQMRWEDLDRLWYPTSPNIPTPAAARAYAVAGLLGELGLVNIGIGSALPFQVVGSPTITFDSVLVRRCMRNGVTLLDYVFSPTTGRFAKEICRGYLIDVGRSAQPIHAALDILASVIEQSPAHRISETSSQSIAMFEKAIGSSAVLPMLRSKPTPAQIEKVASGDIPAFRERRARHLLYP